MSYDLPPAIFYGFEKRDCPELIQTSLLFTASRSSSSTAKRIIGISYHSLSRSHQRPQPTPAHSSPPQLPSHPLQPPRLHRRTYSSARFHQPHRKPDMVFLYLSGFESAIYGLCQLRSELSIFRGVLLQSRVALDRPPGPIFTLQG